MRKARLRAKITQESRAMIPAMKKQAASTSGRPMIAAVGSRRRSGLEGATGLSGRGFRTIKLGLKKVEFAARFDSWPYNSYLDRIGLSDGESFRHCRICI